MITRRCWSIFVVGCGTRVSVFVHLGCLGMFVPPTGNPSDEVVITHSGRSPSNQCSIATGNSIEHWARGTPSPMLAIAAEDGSEGNRHSPVVNQFPQSRHSGTSRETPADSCPATRVSVSLGGLTISWEIPSRSRQAREREFRASTERASPCISSRPPSIHRFLNVSCNPRQLKALAVPPIRNQIPLQTGTSTRAKQRGIRPSVLLCALCPALHGHGRRIGALLHKVQNAPIRPS